MQAVKNIIIVEDETLVRKGLRALIEEQTNLRVVYEAANGLDVLNWFKNYSDAIHIDVALMDIEMPIMNGWETTKYLVKNYSATVLGLSSHDDEKYISKLIDCGARGYLIKDQEITDVVMAIEKVSEMGFYFGNRIKWEGVNRKVEEKELTMRINTCGLTEKEQMVAQLISLQYTSVEIANKMNITRSTVDSHREKIMAKAKAKNMIGIFLYCLHHRLIEVIEDKQEVKIVRTTRLHRK